jgi:broad specificity phosphatase PhoE
MSLGNIFLVRHAESKHNVDKDFQQLDPPLTAAGSTAAMQFGTTFPFSDTVGVVLSSPSQRAIETALAAFSNILDRRYFEPSSGKGIEEGAILVVDLDAQEQSSLPCDTCSDRETLRHMFPLLDFSRLPGGEEKAWTSKTGRYSAEKEAIEARVVRLRQTLEDLLTSQQSHSRRDVVVVTHGVFMRSLTGDSIIDLPRPGYATCHLRREIENQPPSLVATG